jgi:hypothetical protein
MPFYAKLIKNAVDSVQKPVCNSEFGRIFFGLGLCAANSQTEKNRAFRFNSSVLLSQALRDFRYNAPEDGRFPIGMDCSGRNPAEANFSAKLPKGKRKKQ